MNLPRVNGEASWDTTTPRRRLPGAVRLLLIGAGVGLCCGLLSAIFLTALDGVTKARTAVPAFVFALPLLGVAIAVLYQKFGTELRKGNNLALRTLATNGPSLPLRMAPMVLVGTLLTHLGGGSAGREGTAVQMGATVADGFSQRFAVEAAERRLILLAGIAGGFGSVFGTPWAGAIFAVEVIALGKLEWRAVPFTLFVALIGAETTHYLGILHTPYPTLAKLPFSLELLGAWGLFSIAVALTATSFIESQRALRKLLEKKLANAVVRSAVGGVLLVAGWLLVRSNAYLGLGVPEIVSAFETPAAPEAFALKLVFTVITLSFGFIGGEVTPLFFIGSSLGSALAGPLGLPLGLSAGVGLAAVFGCAANAPLALSVMAVELFGIGILPHVLFVNLLASFLSGARGIYEAQLVHRTKFGRRVIPPRALEEL